MRLLKIASATLSITLVILGTIALIHVLNVYMIERELYDFNKNLQQRTDHEREKRQAQCGGPEATIRVLSPTKNLCLTKRGLRHTVITQ